MTDFDVIIIGAGPAGATAGLFCKRFGLDYLILDNPEQPSQMTLATEIENYPAFERISGTELLKKMKNKLNIKEEKVVNLEIKKDKKIVTTERNQDEAKTVIVATGASHRKAGIKGEAEFLGKGVSYCASCDGMFFKGKDVIVWGGGDSALSSAIYLQNIGCKVTIVHRRQQLRAAKALVDKAKKLGIKFALGRTIKQISGKKLVERIIFDNNEQTKCSAVFICIGEVPVVELAKKAGVQTDENGFIIVDAYQQTNIDGVFAAGDVTITPLRQIITAAADGAKAAFAVYRYLEERK